MNIEQEILGFAPNGKPMIMYTLSNCHGMRVKVINIGAAIASIEVPDRNGNTVDVALGYQDHMDYFRDPAALGKSVGRYANRIAKGRFTLNGKEHRLAINNGPNHLHGGPTGFQFQVWEGRIESDFIVLQYVSADGEENYPGELVAEVAYRLSEENELEIVYLAQSDKDTIVNLTNHVYFNLNGEGSGDVMDQMLRINASKYLPIDSVQIPTGEMAPVAGTPMDFRNAKPIGRDINTDFEQLKIGKGYDHCWIIDNWKKGELNPAAELYSEKTGIDLQVSTTQPGVQIYTGNWLDGTGVSKAGKEHKDYEGVAIECQNFPDSPNKENFPSPVLKAGEKYEQHIVFSFSVR